MMKLNLILSVITIFLLAGCHHAADLSIAPPKPHQPGSEFKCSHDTVYFHNFVLPVITSGCAKSGCHDALTQEEGLQLDNYYSIRSMVIPFDPANSKLYTVLFVNEEHTMPPDKPFNDEQKSIIYWWINQGAYDNRCDSIICDSSNVTFTKSIDPVLQLWCTGCHGGPNPANGISLEGYNNAVNCAAGGRLMGAIRQEYGYYPMPKGGNMLSPCEIDLFQKWINTGMPQ